MKSLLIVPTLLFWRFRAHPRSGTCCAAADPDALFDKDPRPEHLLGGLSHRKRVALKNYWDQSRANGCPSATSSTTHWWSLPCSVVGQFFGARPRKPVATRPMLVVAVPDGDLVTVVTVAQRKDLGGEPYTTVRHVAASPTAKPTSTGIPKPNPNPALRPQVIPHRRKLDGPTTSPTQSLRSTSPQSSSITSTPRLPPRLVPRRARHRRHCGATAALSTTGLVQHPARLRLVGSAQPPGAARGRSTSSTNAGKPPRAKLEPEDKP